MNYIYGCISNRGLDNVSQKINKSIQHISCQSTSSWEDENVLMGSKIRYNKPSSIHEKYPLVYRDLVVVANARLDYVSELMNRLGIEGAEHDYPDGFLIAKAYEKWGEQCVNYLEGDWAIAVWDKKRRELFLAKDHFGHTGVYFYHQGAEFMFSSSLEPIKAVYGRELKVNDLYLAGVMLGWRPIDGQSIYEEVMHLRPGHYLKLNGGKVIQTRYWKPELLSEDNSRNEDQLIEEFLELYEEAIKTRLNCYGSYVSMLSGGLDSNSLVALLSKQSSSVLPAYTFQSNLLGDEKVPKNKFTNELYYAKQTASFLGNVKVNRVFGNKYSILESIEKQLDLHQMPFHSGVNGSWLLELFDRVKEDGHQTLFTAKGGNGTISWPGITELNNLDRTKKMLKSSMKQFRKFTSKHDHPLIREHVFKTCAIEKNISKSQKIFESPKIRRSIQNRMKVTKVHFTTSGQLKQDIILGLNLNIVDPTKDKRLLEWCFRAPDSIFRKGDLDRYLIRESMKGLLPDEVRLNPKTGIQYAHGLKKCGAEKQEIIDSIKGIKSNEEVGRFLDIKALQELGDEIENLNVGELNGQLIRALTIGLFLNKE